jgi:LPS export ABC transporter protein LptC
MVCKTKVFLTLESSVFPLLFRTLLSSFFLFLITACGNDFETVNAITMKKTGPSMSAKNIEVLFSNSGRIEAKLTSVLLDKYDGQNPYLEFPHGFNVIIYDSVGRVESTITGNYGKQNEISRIMEAKGNVIVRNEMKNQQINTEKLIWDENRRLIFSDVKVKVTTADKILYADGLKANESFTWYEFENPRGQMTVKKDSI